MKVWIVQGEHWNVPGTPMTAHLTPTSANREANKLTNILLQDVTDTSIRGTSIDLDSPESVRDEAIQKIVDSLPGFRMAGVWITELEVQE